MSSRKWDVIVKMEEVGVILLSSSEDEIPCEIPCNLLW